MLQFRREQMIMKMSMLKKITVCASAGVMFASFSATIASAANDDYAKFKNEKMKVRETDFVNDINDCCKP